MVHPKYGNSRIYYFYSIVFTNDLFTQERRTADRMTDYIKPEVYGSVHIKYILMGLAMWTFIPLIGKNFLTKSQNRIAAIVLIIFTIGQEVLNDSALMAQGLWRLSDDLPLHMCGFSLFLTSWALYFKNQTTFELAYFWGIAASTQAILTPDLSGIWNPIGVFVFFFSHSIIILNVIWLLVVEKMRLRKSAFVNTIIVTNGFAFLISIFNIIVDGNYWYLCTKPITNNPFVLGEWPFYILSIQIAGILIMGLIYLPWLPYFRRLRLQTEADKA